MNNFFGNRKSMLIAMILLVASAGLAIGEERIQLAILLDTSNSMDGLIGQAKSQLWNVVNELARARRSGRLPRWRWRSSSTATTACPSPTVTSGWSPT